MKRVVATRVSSGIGRAVAEDCAGAWVDRPSAAAVGSKAAQRLTAGTPASPEAR